MDLVNLGGKFLQSVRSGRALSILASPSDRPEVPARAAAAAAVARTLAGLPPHQRLTLPSTLEGTPAVYGSRPRGEKPEELDEQFYEQNFDPVRFMLEKLPDGDVDQKYFEAQVTQRLLQLDVNTERLSRQVMEHHEEMVKGMQLVMELEKDLQVTTIICKNGRRNLSSATHEVSQDLIVTSNVKRKQVLLDILPMLVKIQHAMDIKARLESTVEEGNYAKALQMCSMCMQLMDECSGISAIMDMNHSIEDWLQRTLEKVDGVLLEVCRRFQGESYQMAIDAYAMIDDGGLGEKIQNFFIQIVVSETHAVLKTLLYEGEDPRITQKKSRLPYNDLCLQMPESKFRHCLHKTLEVLFDLMCSYYAMMMWQPPQKEIEDTDSAADLSGPRLNGKHKRSGSHGSLVGSSLEAHHNRASSFSFFESQPGVSNCSPLQSAAGARGSGNRYGVASSANSSLIEKVMENQNGDSAEQRQDSFQDFGKELDEAVSGGSLDDVTEKLRKETLSNVGKALEKGRKHVWELAARRVSALLSSDSVCTTSPHHFLQSLDWVNRFVLAGEAFSGAEALSLRAKLVKLCEKYFGTFHRQNLEVLRMMLEKETWQQLSPEAMKTVNLAGLMGDGAPVLVASPVRMSGRVDTRGLDGTSMPRMEHANASSGTTEDGKEGFAFWLEGGNPFAERKHQIPSVNESMKPPSGDAAQSANDLSGEKGLSADLGNGLRKTQLLSGIPDNGITEQDVSQVDDMEEEENEDLLADFIDEDSQLPSRVYSNFRNVPVGVPKDSHVHTVDDSVILTGSSVSILRYMDRYARLMQILQPIATDVFKGFCQLFELYFYVIFKTFGQRDAFGSGRGQADSPNVLTARLRATLVRVSQGLEEQRSKNTSGSTPAHLNVPSIQLGHSETTQAGPVQGVSGGLVSVVNLYGLKERCAAVESLSSVAQMLKRSRARLQALLPQDALASLENFYIRTVDVVPDLKEHVYRTIARMLLNIGGYVDRVANVRWELKELGMEHNGYVDLLLGEYKHYANRLAHGDISKEIHDLLLEYGVDTIAEMLLEGLSRIKRCTNEGRALMSLDLQVLINGLRHLAPSRLSSNLHVVETYIKAFYLPETEYTHWVRAHPEYTKGQVVGLINLVAFTNNWKRKTRVELLEKIEAGEL